MEPELRVPDTQQGILHLNTVPELNIHRRTDNLVITLHQIEG